MRNALAICQALTGLLTNFDPVPYYYDAGDGKSYRWLQSLSSIFYHVEDCPTMVALPSAPAGAVRYETTLDRDVQILPLAREAAG